MAIPVESPDSIALGAAPTPRLPSHTVTEAFSFLDPIHRHPGIRAAWVERIEGVDVNCDRDGAMRNLRDTHQDKVAAFAGAHARWWRAEQVHGHQVAVVPGAGEITAPDGLPVMPAVDGLITAEPGQVLSIYVADCGAIWLADKRSQAIGLLHSGKRGTESNILGQAVRLMGERFGSRAEDLVSVLSPCIRRPHYEIDFAADIAAQAEAAGISDFTDCGLNTAVDPQRFYSYRMQHGKTGRMMALLVRDA